MLSGEIKVKKVTIAVAVTTYILQPISKIGSSTGTVR